MIVIGRMDKLAQDLESTAVYRIINETLTKWHLFAT